MFVALVDEHCDSPPFNNIYASTLQRETLVREIADRNSEPRSAFEPSLHNARIGGGDAVHVAGL